MLLFKYEGFIHDFVVFDGCLLDPEAKIKGKMVFSQRFITPNSPRLASSSLELKI